MAAHVYAYKSMLIIPTLAATEAGFFMEVEPVAVLHEPSVSSLASALAGARSRGLSRVPTPTRGSYPPPVVLRHARAHSLREFEEAARVWKLEWLPDGVAVIPTRVAAEGGWEDINDRREVIRGADALERAAERIVEEVSRPQ